MHELYKKHRPRRFEKVVGNEQTKASLQNMIERKTLPHTILFHGPSGCGKTTMARILKDMLECSDMDFKELNCSDFRGIDTIRDISRTMHLSPSGGRCRIWLLDEVHQMSKDGQNAALKIFEDTPAHVYFILCTTDPNKLLKTIRTRCCEMPVSSLSHKQTVEMLGGVLKREQAKVKDEVLADIADAAAGSARQALVLLDKVLNLPENLQADAIKQAESEAEAIDLCRALIKKESWKKVSSILSNIEGDPESIRWAVMGYARAVLLKTADYQAYNVICCFENNFFDSKDAGLVKSCYEAIHGES